MGPLLHSRADTSDISVLSPLSKHFPVGLWISSPLLKNEIQILLRDILMLKNKNKRQVPPSVSTFVLRWVLQNSSSSWLVHLQRWDLILQHMILLDVAVLFCLERKPGRRGRREKKFYRRSYFFTTQSLFTWLIAIVGWHGYWPKLYGWSSFRCRLSRHSFFPKASLITWEKVPLFLQTKNNLTLDNKS